MSNDDEKPKPVAPFPDRKPQRESAIGSDLDYVRQRQAEMDSPYRGARYRPEYDSTLSTPEAVHRIHERSTHCTCGRAERVPCPVCDLELCAHCYCQVTPKEEA